MFTGNLTDQMALADAAGDCRAADLQVTFVDTGSFIIVYVKEANDFPLTSGTFSRENLLGAIHFLVTTRNDYRSWN